MLLREGGDGAIVLGDCVYSLESIVLSDCEGSFKPIVLTVGLSLKVTFLGAFLEVFVGLRVCWSRRGVCSEGLALVKAIGTLVVCINSISIDKKLKRRISK